MERTINGEITAWTKEAKEQTPGFYTVGFMIDNKWHNMAGNDKSALEHLKETAPVGSLVEFMEYQAEGSNFWKYKPATWKVIKKGDGTRNGGNSNWKKGGNYGYRPNKEEYFQEKASIQLLSILKTTIEARVPDSQKKEMFEGLLAMHNEHLKQQANFLQGLQVQNQTEESADEIKEQTMIPGE